MLKDLKIYKLLYENTASICCFINGYLLFFVYIFLEIFEYFENFYRKQTNTLLNCATYRFEKHTEQFDVWFLCKTNLVLYPFVANPTPAANG